MMVVGIHKFATKALLIRLAKYDYLYHVILKKIASIVRLQITLRSGDIILKDVIENLSSQVFTNTYLLWFKVDDTSLLVCKNFPFGRDHVRR